MAGEIIRLGDSTSHGGIVLEGSPFDICIGKPIAYLGHKVQFPKCKGVFPIVEGAPTTTFYGKGVALAGMHTACGAVLIASQFTDMVECGGGGTAVNSAARSSGGGYDFKYGAIKGKRNDPWRFSDFSTHPGPGFGGSTTAAGMYQITIATWRQHGGKMGLTNFSHTTQDLIAVEILRSLRIIDKIRSGDIAAAIGPAARTWAALPMGHSLGNAHPPQPFVKYEDFFHTYQAAGGTGK